jgi:hypothetical protein
MLLYSVFIVFHSHMLGFCELYDEQNSEKCNINPEIKALLLPDTKRYIKNSPSFFILRSQCMQVISNVCFKTQSFDLRFTKI